MLYPPSFAASAGKLIHYGIDYPGSGCNKQVAERGAVAFENIEIYVSGNAVYPAPLAVLPKVPFRIYPGSVGFKIVGYP